MLASFPGAVRKTPPKSVHDHARYEAEKHKWIESERNGRDLGQQAIEDWYQKFWAKYCRARRLEHLCGKQQWVEFAEHEYGRMYELIMSGNALLQELVVRVEEGWENLHFTTWVHKERKPREEIDRILELLEIININIARLEPRLHQLPG